MFFYFLFCLQALVSSAFISNGLSINIETVSLAPVVNYGSSPNTCGHLLAHDKQLYHVSSENVYQNAQKGSIDTLLTTINVTTSPNTVLDFGVSYS